MKKLSIRYLIVICLAVLSVTSYTYLSCVASHDASAQSEVSSEGELREHNTYLPDVALIKKVLETGKRFVPKSS